MTQYTKEFREQAILLSDEIGVKKAAEQLGVVYSTLLDWRKRRNSMKKSTPAESTDLYSMAKFFGISLGDLSSRIEEKLLHN